MSRVGGVGAQRLAEQRAVGQRELQVPGDQARRRGARPSGSSGRVMTPNGLDARARRAGCSSRSRPYSRWARSLLDLLDRDDATRRAGRSARCAARCRGGARRACLRASPPAGVATAGRAGRGRAGGGDLECHGAIVARRPGRAAGQPHSASAVRGQVRDSRSVAAPRRAPATVAGRGDVSRRCARPVSASNRCTWPAFGTEVDRARPSRAAAAVDAGDDRSSASRAVGSSLGVAVDVGVGAELLDDVDLDRDARRRSGDEVEVLGTEADGDRVVPPSAWPSDARAASGTTRAAELRRRRRRPGRSSRFIAGEPMKPATKTLAGVSYRSRGVSHLLQHAVLERPRPGRPSSWPRPGRG